MHSQVNSTRQRSALRRLVLMGMLVGLAAVGSVITIPGVIGSPALDALPAYFASFVLGAGPGAVVGTVGHLLTAMLHGFPLTLPVHVVIAVEMAVVVAAAAWVQRRLGWGAGFVWTLLANGLLAPAVFIPWFGVGFFTAAVPQLLVATALNAGLAILVAKATGPKRLGRTDREG